MQDYQALWKWALASTNANAFALDGGALNLEFFLFGREGDPLLINHVDITLTKKKTPMYMDHCKLHLSSIVCLHVGKKAHGHPSRVRRVPGSSFGGKGKREREQNDFGLIIELEPIETSCCPALKSTCH